METEKITELARQIAARMGPDALLDPADVAAILGCRPRYVTEYYALAPGFPRAIRLTGRNGARSKPKWRRQDIEKWIDDHRRGRPVGGGRRRNPPP